jgi:hypothetical protein
MRLRVVIIAAMVVAFRAGGAPAQTTQPAPAAWGLTIINLAQALTAESGAAQTSAILGDDAVVRQFGGTQNRDRYFLLDRTEKLTVISARAYTWPAETLAADLAADCKASENLPLTLRRRYMPRDEAEMKRANTVARQWMVSSLDPSGSDLVAMIVLWEAPPPVTNSLMLGTAPVTEFKHPLFILIKGRQNVNGDIQISQILFGDASQALK